MNFYETKEVKVDWEEIHFREKLNAEMSRVELHNWKNLFKGQEKWKNFWLHAMTVIVLLAV